MRTLLRYLLPLLLLGAAPPIATVDYSLAPEMTGDAIGSLRVTAHFVGDRSGTTRFDWVDKWAGEERLGQWARDIVVTGATSVDPAPHGGRIIHAPPGAPITVTYRIVSAFAGDPTDIDSKQPMPVVRPGWFYSVGEALFAIPDGRGDAPARFAWNGPRNIGFASDLEHPSARPGMATKTVDDITESIVIGGRDLRVTRMNAGGAPLRIATIGHYTFGIEAFETMAQTVVATERRFWDDRDPRPFLIAMAPVVPQPNHISYSGTGRSDAFALWMEPDVDLSGLVWLLGHEYFHRWNFRQLGTLPDGDAESTAYWFSEGFTDFYARRLMLRAGLLTPVQFAANWNEMLVAYARSPFRTASNAAAATAFWKDDAAQKLPYQRGAMLAAIWDRRLRQAGRGTLDAVLRDQRRRAMAAEKTARVTSLFTRVAAAHGLDVRPDLARYLNRGEPIVLPTDAFGRCAMVKTVTRPVFERGWDTAATAKAGNVVTGLDPASPAYAAGLRDGMKLLRRTTGIVGNSQVDYGFVVNDGKGERPIVFRPEGKTTETIQQIVLDKALFAADRRGCAAGLAGLAQPGSLQ